MSLSIMVRATTKSHYFIQADLLCFSLYLSGVDCLYAKVSDNDISVFTSSSCEPRAINAAFKILCFTVSA